MNKQPKSTAARCRRAQIQTARARVPASTSNCGAGFDTVGLALRLYNDITLARGADEAIRPATASDAPGQSVVEAAAALFFKRTGAKPFGVTYHIEGEVPMSRGLGSSVTLRAGVIAALRELARASLTRRAIVALVAELEGHPDNAAAAVLGGFCVARTDPETGAFVDAIRVPIPAALAFVVVSPAVEILTQDSRGMLPAQLPYFDAVKSVNSAAYLVAALATRDYARLRHAVADFLHEPYRLPRIPGARAAIAAGMAAGALAGWLSGSGSSVLCVARRRQAGRVGAAMAAAFRAVKIDSRVYELQADNRGLAVTARRC